MGHIRPVLWLARELSCILFSLTVGQILIHEFRCEYVNVLSLKFDKSGASNASSGTNGTINFTVAVGENVNGVSHCTKTRITITQHAPLEEKTEHLRASVWKHWQERYIILRVALLYMKGCCSSGLPGATCGNRFVFSSSSSQLLCASQEIRPHSFMRPQSQWELM